MLIPHVYDLKNGNSVKDDSKTPFVSRSKVD